MMTDMSMDFLEKQGASAAKALEVLREELPLQRFVGPNLSQAVVADLPVPVAPSSTISDSPLLMRSANSLIACG